MSHRHLISTAILLALLAPLNTRLVLTDLNSDQTLAPNRGQNPEGSWALGQKASLRGICVNDLERIPGIGPTRAGAILDAALAVSLNPHSTTLDFQTIKGIGPKLSQVISQYLDLEERPPHSICGHHPLTYLTDDSG